MKLSPYVVGYFDLLGFSSDLLEVEHDHSRLMGRSGKFEVTKSLASGLIRENLNSRVDIRWLSDSFICAAIVDPFPGGIVKALQSVLTAIGIAQCKFSCEDYFSRGGIALGVMNQASSSNDLDDEIFGPGIVRAAIIEKNVKYPCIGLSAHFAEYLPELKNTVHGHNIAEINSHGFGFLNYLAFAEYIWPERPDQIIAGHAELVHNLIVRADEKLSLREKASWLLTYHNEHVKRRGGLEKLIIKLSRSWFDFGLFKKAKNIEGYDPLHLELLKPSETMSSALIEKIFRPPGE